MGQPGTISRSTRAWTAVPRPLGPARFRFPPAAFWPDDDLVAVGGELDPATILDGYRRGVFPMEVAELPGYLGWWSPDPRGILPLDRLRVTRSLRQNAKRYEVRLDTCFDRVIRACADPSRPHGWITSDVIRAYTTLHEFGWAHSVEVFDRDGELAGGLYGVRVGGFFAGESMFHTRRDGSKVALMALVELMGESRMALLDVQWCTDHLATLGAIEISRADYLARLAAAIAHDA